MEGNPLPMVADIEFNYYSEKTQKIKNKALLQF